MYLYLSRHGIWYYRKCYLVASGKRKEIKKSLGTRDKRQAKLLVARIHTSSYSAEIGQIATSFITQDKIPPLSKCISRYIKENRHLWQDRHQKRIEGVLSEIPKVHLTKADVSKLKNKWLEALIAPSHLSPYMLS